MVRKSSFCMVAVLCFQLSLLPSFAIEKGGDLSYLNHASTAIEHNYIQLSAVEGRVTLRYPQFKHDWLNQLVEEPALTWYVDMAKICRNTVEEGNKPQWHYSDEIELLYYNGAILVLSMEGREEHPERGLTYRKRYLNIDLKSQRTLMITDLFNQQELMLLQQLGERIFRHERGIPQEGSLHEYGYRFKYGFRLAKEYAITDKGLQFTYNRHDIASPELGIIEFTIPYRELFLLNSYYSGDEHLLFTPLLDLLSGKS